MFSWKTFLFALISIGGQRFWEGFHQSLRINPSKFPRQKQEQIFGCEICPCDSSGD
jgi:hypothetical protein